MSIADTETLLTPGMRLTREEFLRRWELLPDLKNAELLNGVVHTPSPVSRAMPSRTTSPRRGSEVMSA